MPATPISPFLWFDTEAEDAARFYTGIFPDSRVVSVARYGEAGKEFHRREPGSVMVVAFELNGQPFSALNGGPAFQFSPAVSFVIPCDTQAEIDHYWEKLGEGGDESARQCGWLKDKYGLSWQVIPQKLPELVSDANSPACQRAMAAMMGMTKLNLAEFERAHAG